MQLLRLPAWIACLPLALVLASCAGGGGAPSAVSPGATSANPGSPGASKAAGVVPARFTFLIPLASKHAATRSSKPQYLPASAQSIEIDTVQVNGITPVPAPSPTIANVGSTLPGCTTAIGGLTCTVALGLPIGSVTVLVKAFDAAGATGNVLSQQQSIFAVAQGSANSFAMTLDASPGSIVVTPPSSGVTCSGSPLACATSGTSALNFSVTVADTNGTPLADNTIGGSPVLSAMSSDTTIASVTATQNPYAIALTPVGSGTATITMTASPATGTSGLTPTTLTFTLAVTIVSLHNPFGVAVDASGNIYATNIGNSTVTKYAASGGAPTLTISNSVNSPTGVALDASGNIYVANNNANTVTKYGADGGAPILTISNSLSQPTGVVLDASGNIYVVNQGNSTVTKYATSGGAPTLTISSGLSAPIGVALDASLNIYVANKDNNTVTKYAPGGGVPTLTITNGLNRPSGVAVDASGNIYVASENSNTVGKYAASGAGPSLTISSGLSLPTGVALDASGNIYVSNVLNNTVTKYAPTGGSPILTIH